MKKFGFIAIILVIVVILTISYSVYIYNSQNTDFVGWLNTLISTLISVLLALIIATYLFYYQANLIQEDTKNKHIPLIEKNLIEIWKNLSNLEEPMKIQFNDKEELDFYLLNIPNIIFEQAVCSNVFDIKQTGFLLEMKSVVDYHNAVIEQFINTFARFDENSDSYKKSLKFLHINNKNSMIKLKESIESANEYFKFTELDNEIKKNL